jgi:hypothetical protein
MVLPAMKTLLGIIEDGAGNVVGAVTDLEPEMRLDEGDIMPRSQLRQNAVALAAKYDIDPASFTVPAPTPAPEGSGSPQ